MLLPKIISAIDLLPWPNTMLVRVLDGQSPRDILDTDLYFIDRIGLHDHLSPTRSNGLVAMVKKIRSYALAYTMANHE